MERLEESLFEELKTSGTKVNYYFVCKRKLWLFSRGIGLEGSSERVSLGKLLHQYSYKRYSKKGVLIDNLIAVDLIGSEEVGEVKYSDRLSEAARWQLLYYLFYLKQLGIERRGVINYPRQRKREEVELTPEAERELLKVLREIKEIEELPTPPPPQKLPYCKRCSYYELCFVE
ncbi:CRISPR-associated protein Cas4 [Thermovibrio sp.]